MPLDPLDTPFDRAVRIVQQIRADMGWVPSHLIGQWEGLIAAEIADATDYQKIPSENPP